VFVEFPIADGFHESFFFGKMVVGIVGKSGHGIEEVLMAGARLDKPSEFIEDGNEFLVLGINAGDACGKVVFPLDREKLGHGASLG